MFLFEAVKDAVTARQAAEAYGIEVTRSGMARCAFHNDHNPSMKLDKRYHCFACQADGDVIDLVAQLFGLGKKEAAEKLATDFCIDYESRKSVNKRSAAGKRKSSRKRDRERREALVQTDRKLQNRFEEAEKRFFRILTDYLHLLKKWQEKRAPVSEGDEADEYFCEALQNLSIVEYVLDCFMEGSLEERIDIMIDYGKKVKEFEGRIEKYRSEKACEAGEDNGSPGAGAGFGRH